jgi:hypothetical protein
MRDIMLRIQAETNLEDSDNPALPSKYFHMMEESDTGGYARRFALRNTLNPSILLVIMLNRLNMSIDMASEALHKIIEGVWNGTTRTPEKRTVRLKKALEELLSSIGIPIDAKLEAERREDNCLRC